MSGGVGLGGGAAGGADHWSVEPLWAQTAATGGGLTIVLAGVHEDNSHRPGRRAEEKEPMHETRRRAQGPPPPPVTFYDYYTWRVDSV